MTGIAAGLDCLVRPEGTVMLAAAHQVAIFLATVLVLSRTDYLKVK